LLRHISNADSPETAQVHEVSAIVDLAMRATGPRRSISMEAGARWAPCPKDFALGFELDSDASRKCEICGELGVSQRITGIGVLDL
jgi:hypothetical protein